MIAKVSPTVLAAKSSKNTYTRMEVGGFNVILVRKIARLPSLGRGHCIQVDNTQVLDIQFQVQTSVMTVASFHEWKSSRP